MASIIGELNIEWKAKYAWKKGLKTIFYPWLAHLYPFMKFRLITLIVIAVAAGLFLFFIGGQKNSVSVSTMGNAEDVPSPFIENMLGLKDKPTEKASEVSMPAGNTKLPNPPEKITAVYSTSWSASSKTKIDYFIDLIKTTQANAVVIDIKDYSGTLAYVTDDAAVMKYATIEKKISDPAGLVRKFHENGIYTIARVTVFQDPALAAKRPDLAIKNKTTGKVWADRKNLSWMDPASKEVWDYNVSIAKNAFLLGFDEVNFDYVRFPSDGDLTVMAYSQYQGDKTKSQTIKEFFLYLRENLKDERISADLFGLTVTAKDDLGIGQILEDALGSFDAVCPMIYPSHFANGFMGYKNPADHPYEVIKHSMEEAGLKVASWKEANPGKDPAKIRPWLQDFDLGADYGNSEIKDQVKAVSETGNDGWMMWSPQNVYTRGGIEKL
ncbi:MAG: putative glycoside hydrolase [Candidatus Colwellbacteria bacterium]|nr:putative glycoside hydrolase [Candidatus Colwellbacteria bacterium]